MSTVSNPASDGEKLVFPLNRDFATGAIQLDLSSYPKMLAALRDPDASLPEDDVVARGVLSAAPGKNITMGPAKVAFSADADAAIGIFSTPAAVREAVLTNAGLLSQISDTLSFPGKVGTRLLMLRWGYNIAGTAAGDVALGPSANLSFSANAGRRGYYAIVQEVLADARAVTSLTNLVSSWKLPSQVDDISKLPPSTTLISEVDGSLAVGAKVTFGYDFSWLRAVDGVGLRGDVGLKLAAGLSASVCFGLSGKYAIVLSREGAAEQIRLRLYKLRVDNWSFGFDGSLAATAEVPLPGDFDDLLKAVTGTHGQQIMKLLGRVEDWTDPNKPIFGPFVNMTNTEAQKLITAITGVSDLAGEFDEAKSRIEKLVGLWNELPQTIMHLIWSNLPDPTAISSISGIAHKVAQFTSSDLTQFIQNSLGNVPFLSTAEGKALESLAADGLFAALQDSAALAKIQKAAGHVGQILDGGALQGLLTRLQNAVNTRLDLKKLDAVVDQATLGSLDDWLKARLETFLEQKLVGAQGVEEVKKLRAGLNVILAKKDELYAKALTALKHNYNLAFHATYQKTASSSALLDLAFDFSVPGSEAGTALKLALAGKFDQLLSGQLKGVKINEGVLAFGLRKETHISISLPYFSTESTHVNDAVAQLQAVSEDAGELMFSLAASDLYSIKNDFSSALTIALAAPSGGQNAVSVHSMDGTAYRYALKVASPSASAQGLSLQYAPYADTYFPTEFSKMPPGSFSDWIKQLAPASGRLGNTLISLDLSLPSSAVEAWTRAPRSSRDMLYKKMSIALQRQFKQVLHDTFFSNVHKYKGVSGESAVNAVLAFCSIPACSDVDLVNDGNDIMFMGEDAEGKTIYWDYRDRGENSFSVDLRKKVLFHQATQTNLRQKLLIARKRILEAGDPDRVLSSYSDSATGRILGGALQGTYLDFLFPVEATMVEQARTAGLHMASFREHQFSNPERARKDLAKFGQKLSEDFGAHLKDFAVGNALMPLGTAIYAAGASALDPDAAKSLAAMFTIQMLRAGLFTLTPCDTDVLRTERVVHGG